MVRAFRKSCITLLFISFFINAGNNEELFLRANKSYEEQDYNKALALYEAIPHKSSAVLYNIGNCYFHKEEYAHALLYWARAEKEANSQEYAAISTNKQYVLQKLGKTGTATWLHRGYALCLMISHYLSLWYLQILFLVLWFLFLLSCCRIGVKTMHSCFMLLVLLLSSSVLCTLWYDHSTSVGVVVQQQAPLFAGPDKKLDTLRTLAYADHIVVKEVRKGWYKVRYSDTIGWIEADAMQVI